MAGFSFNLRHASDEWQQLAGPEFRKAAAMWESIIIESLPPVEISPGTIIENIRVDVAVTDGELGGRFAQAGPEFVRPESADRWSLLPATGKLWFDRADLINLRAKGTLVSVLMHELGHVLGIGTLWNDKRLLRGFGTAKVRFIGSSSVAEYSRLMGSPQDAVPVENTGGKGAANLHWREEVFREELMSTYIDPLKSPLSRLSIANLEDLGYSVHYSSAENYRLSRLQDKIRPFNDPLTPLAPPPPPSPDYAVQPTQIIRLPAGSMVEID